MVVICRVSNGNNIILSPKHLQAAYTDVRHWEELIDFINKRGRPKKPFILSSRYNCSLEQDEMDNEYMGVYTNGQLIMEPIYGQISYNCCLSNAFKLKLGQNPKNNLIEMMRATGQNIAEHVNRPVKVIPASHVTARCAQLLIIIHRLW